MARIRVAGSEVTSLAGSVIASAASGAEIVAAATAVRAAVFSTVAAVNRGEVGAPPAAVGVPAAGVEVELATTLTGTVPTSAFPVRGAVPRFDCVGWACAGVAVDGFGVEAFGGPPCPVGPRPDGPVTVDEPAVFSVGEVVEESVSFGDVVAASVPAFGPVGPHLVPELVPDDPRDPALLADPAVAPELEPVDVEEVCESAGAARAMPGLAAAAAPTPNATANPPTRPMYFAERITGFCARTV